MRKNTMKTVVIESLLLDLRSSNKQECNAKLGDFIHNANLCVVGVGADEDHHISQTCAMVISE